ncbi:LysR family transcriptional regulator [Achromobacter animicus]|uniref:LysR family transcriptional regulator n=1 Tax=Achromobacter animicus TaxID=1389935 RepID=UPI0028AC5357|nr:LysR family transcriptional regulator [Achromobacter animicus]
MVEIALSTVKGNIVVTLKPFGYTLQLKHHDQEMRLLPPDLVGRLKFRHLRFVVTLAETGSMTRAADHLSISYPAVAKTRSEIEEALGTRLLIGRGDTATFSQIGELLLKASRRVIDELGCVSEEISAVHNGLRGHVSVGVRAPDALRWLAPRVVDFCNLFPGVSVALKGELHEGLVRGDVDIALARSGPMRIDADLDFHALFKVRSVVVGSGNYAQEPLASWEWPSLLAERWVLPPAGTPLRDRFDIYLRDHGYKPPAHFVEIDVALAQAAMLRAGSFLALASESAAADLVERGLAQIVMGKITALDDCIALIWKSTGRLHPAVERLRQFLLDHKSG